VAQKLLRETGLRFNPDTAILIPSGATFGIYAALMATLNEGEEVLLPNPIYDASSLQSAWQAAARVGCAHTEGAAFGSASRRCAGRRTASAGCGRSMGCAGGWWWKPFGTCPAACRRPKEAFSQSWMCAPSARPLTRFAAGCDNLTQGPACLRGGLTTLRPQTHSSG
jgi:hypothetical protein